MQYQGNDIYCDLILKGKVEIERLYEDEDVLAFYHTNPYWPVHIIVIPKSHLPSLTDLGAVEASVLNKVIDVVRLMTKKVEEDYGAASVLTNVGSYQHSKHLHFHVYNGEPKR